MSFGIPDGRLYHDNPLSAGSVAAPFDSTAVNTEHAGAEIAFGGAVVIKDGKVIPATAGPIYGVALKRTYVDGDNLFEETIENDKWKAGETLGVMRDGTIWVPISEDVDRGENAAVDSTGKFKPATGNDVVVGVFTSDGEKDSTAKLQTRIQFASSAQTTTASTSTPDNTETNSK